MRKITRNAVRAFQNGRDWHSGNTEVVVYDNGEVVMYLFDNAIAKRSKGGTLRVSDGGYPGKTTKERLNGIPGVNTRQIDWQWYLNGKKWNGNWKIVR